MKFFALLIITLSLFLGGCSKNNPDKFLGTWHQVTKPENTITVTKASENKFSFDVKKPSVTFFPQYTRIGELVEGQVVFNVSEKASIQPNGNLKYLDSEYTR